MLFDPSRHETLCNIEWDEVAVRKAITQIVADTEACFTSDRYWPSHLNDRGANDPEDELFTPLYFGALGIVWSLNYLQDLGAVRLDRSYQSYLEPLQLLNRDWLSSNIPTESGSYLMGDTPFLLINCGKDTATSEDFDTLAELIESNIEHPARELMWGSPGTLLAALVMHRLTGNERWAVLFRKTARKLWSQLIWSEEHQCHYWTQELYGQQSSYLGGVHSFVATASPLIGGRHLLPLNEWADWEQCIANTILRTSSSEDGQVNWRAMLISKTGSKYRYLMQFCHGAPGFIICLADIPGSELNSLLLAAGETIWNAGPLSKGSNLCHGTGGNGYAFLKLYQRTGNELWLHRARSFAMHGIKQTLSDAKKFGQYRYSLWTGDLGFAIYLWDCLNGTASFPTLDGFFAPKLPVASK